MQLRDGRTLGWIVYGDPGGRPVLGFHGAPACRVLFRPADVIARRLGLSLIAPDRPGYGLSSPMVGRTLADWSADTVELLDHLAVPRAAILAVSGGGPYGVAVAAQLGTRITALGLVSPLGEVAAPSATGLLNLVQRTFFVGLPLKYPGILHRAAQVFRAGFLAGPDASLVAFRAGLSKADRCVLSTDVGRQLVIDATREAIESGLDGALSDMTIYARPWGVDLATIRVPACVWQGTADRIVSAALAFDLARRIPQAELRRLDGAGHFWVIAHSETVLSWISEHA